MGGDWWQRKYRRLSRSVGLRGEVSRRGEYTGGETEERSSVPAN